MDTNFVDLDILLIRIREPATKKYFSDAVRSYKAGALRPAISAVWVAIVYDLLAKYRELAAIDDGAARDFIAEWDTATQNTNVEKLLKLEGAILDHATTKTQIINSVAKRQLERLRDDRHLCAHPAFSTEAQLFEPTPELARLHLASAIDLVLGQEPLQGKAIFEQFSVDVQSIGFPTEEAKAFDYVEQRYLSRIRSQNLANFGAVLAKSLLKGVPAEWDRVRGKVGLSLAALRDRSANAWPDVRAAILRIIDSIEPEHRFNVIAFLVQFPDLWDDLREPTRVALLETLRNVEVGSLENFHILNAIRLPQFASAAQRIIDRLSEDQLQAAIGTDPTPQLWSKALAIYAQSGSYRGSEWNFRTFIAPFAGRLSSQQTGELLLAIGRNGQNWSAADTPALLHHLLQQTDQGDLPSRENRDEFVQMLNKVRGRLEIFEDALGLLRRDGWVPPSPRERDEEPNF